MQVDGKYMPIVQCKAEFVEKLQLGGANVKKV